MRGSPLITFIVCVRCVCEGYNTSASYYQCPNGSGQCIASSVLSWVLDSPLPFHWRQHNTTTTSNALRYSQHAWVVDRTLQVLVCVESAGPFDVSSALDEAVHDVVLQRCARIGRLLNPISPGAVGSDRLSMLQAIAHHAVWTLQLRVFGGYLRDLLRLDFDVSEPFRPFEVDVNTRLTNDTAVAQLRRTLIRFVKSHDGWSLAGFTSLQWYVQTLHFEHRTSRDTFDVQLIDQFAFNTQYIVSGRSQVDFDVSAFRITARRGMWFVDECGDHTFASAMQNIANKRAAMLTDDAWPGTQERHQLRRKKMLHRGWVLDPAWAVQSDYSISPNFTRPPCTYTAR